MNRRWKLIRHRRTVYGDVVQDFKGPEWYPNLEKGQTAPARDAQKIHREVGPMNWVKRKSDPVTHACDLDQDNWYTLTQLAEELEG